MDLIIRVCDQAAGEVCPVWPGHPARAHWSAPDPGPFTNDPAKARQVIRDAFNILHRRISLLLSLPAEKLAPDRLEQEAREIAENAAAVTNRSDA